MKQWEYIHSLIVRIVDIDGNNIKKAIKEMKEKGAIFTTTDKIVGDE